KQFGYSTAQVFDLSSVSVGIGGVGAGGGLSPGRHVIKLRANNRIKDINVGQDSHRVTDQTQGNWNGVVGKILLTAGERTWIEDVQVYPDVAGKRALVKLVVRSMDSGGSGEVRLAVGDLVKRAVKYKLNNGVDSLSVE